MRSERIELPDDDGWGGGWIEETSLAQGPDRSLDGVGYRFTIADPRQPGRQLSGEAIVAARASVAVKHEHQRAAGRDWYDLSLMEADELITSYIRSGKSIPHILNAFGADLSSHTLAERQRAILRFARLFFELVSSHHNTATEEGLNGYFPDTFIVDPYDVEGFVPERPEWTVGDVLEAVS